MRTEFLEKLTVPYDYSKQIKPDDMFAIAIGLDVCALRQLRDAIRNDLDTESKGIRWWKDLPSKQRVFISDYLSECAGYVELNLIESTLHWQAFLDSWDKYNLFLHKWAHPASHDFHKRESPIDDLPNYISKLHIAGLVRALGSSLDCFASLIVGVAAISLDIVKADFRTVRNYSKSKNPLQKHIIGELDNCMKVSGPEGWLDWLIDFRNMLVHRSRRLVYGKYAQKSILYDPENKKIKFIEATLILPSRPCLTEIDAWRNNESPWLTESAHITLQAIKQSTESMIAKMSIELLKLWKKRRDNPNLLPQPEGQWKRSRPQTTFNGYSPNTCVIKEGKMAVSPKELHRFRAAALDSDSEDIWKE
jgi:hypothetical protein